jgi:hypothetical protein
MNWLDCIQIGRDVTICPDCHQKYEVINEFPAQKTPGFTNGQDWLDEFFSEEYYIALRCPRCLETRYFRLKSLSQKQYQDAREPRAQREADQQ